MCDRRASGRAIVGAWPHDDDVLRPPCPGALDGGGDTTAVLRRARERFDRWMCPTPPPPTPANAPSDTRHARRVKLRVSCRPVRCLSEPSASVRPPPPPPPRPRCPQTPGKLTHPARIRPCADDASLLPPPRRAFRMVRGRAVSRSRAVCVSRWCWSRRATARRWSRRAAATCTGGAATRTRRGSSGSTRSTRRRRSGSRTSPSTSRRSSPGRARRAASRSRT